MQNRGSTGVEALMSALSRAGIFILSAGMIQSASADLVNPQVESGMVQIMPVANGWVIVQGSQTAIVSYEQFSLAELQMVDFQQPNATAAILNRVTGNFPSNIDGQIFANGIVYLVNPAGIFIGPTGVVNVGQFYAAAGSISDDDFKNGINRFTGISGAVENHGTIMGSRVALVGNSIVNSGTIDVGDGGIMALVASTGEVTLSPTGPNNQIVVQIDSGGAPTSATGVENSGLLKAGAGGQIVLGAGDLYSVAIRNTSTGVIDAANATVAIQAKDMAGNLGAIENDGAIAAGDLTVEGATLTLTSGVNADTAMIDANVILEEDVTISGNGGDATSVTFAQAVNSAAGEANALVVEAVDTTFTGGVGQAANGTLGGLTVTGNVEIADNVSSSGAIQLGDGSPGTTVNFTGAGAQTVLAGTVLDIDADVLKAVGNLVLQAQQLLLGGSSTTVSNGNLSLIAPTISFDGGASQSANASGLINATGSVFKEVGDLLFQAQQVLISGSTVSVGSDLNFAAQSTQFLNVTQQTVTSGGVVAFDGNVSKLLNSLLIEAHQILLGGSSVTINNGNLTLASSMVIFTGAGQQTVLVNGAATGVLDIDGIVLKQVGNLLLQAQNLIQLGGASTLVNGGNLTLNSQMVNFDGAGAQSATVNGLLDVNANLTKATGDLELAASMMQLGGLEHTVSGGNLHLNATDITFDNVNNGSVNVVVSGTLDVDGNVHRPGDLRLEANEIQLGGATTSADGNLTLVSDSIVFDLDNAAQSASAGQVLSLGGDATKASGNLLLHGGSSIELGGAMTQASSGSLTLDAPDVLFTNDAIAQAASASTTLDIRGNVSKAVNNLTLHGGSSIVLAGAKTAAETGDLVLDAPDIILENNQIDQKIAAGGTLDARGNVVKFQKNLTLEGGTSILLSGAKTSADQGDLLLHAPDVIFQNNSIDQKAFAGGVLDISGNVSKAQRDLTLQASAINLGGAKTAADGGSLILDAPEVSFTGDGIDQKAFAGAMLDIRGNVTKAARDLTLESAQGILLSGAMTSANGGALILDAPDVIFNADGIAQSAFAGTTLDIRGNALKAANNLSLQALNQIFFGGSKIAADGGALTLQAPQIVFTADSIDQKAFAQTTLALNGNVSKAQKNLTLEAGDGVQLGGTSTSAAGGDLHVKAPMLTFTGSGAQNATAGGTLTFDGTVTKSIGDLVLTGGNAVMLGPAVTVGGAVAIIGPVLLNADTIVEGTSAVTFQGTINGAHKLTAKSNGNITFNGNIGAGTALTSLETLSQGGTVTFGGSLVNVLNEILLNVNLGQVIAVPAVATITSTGSITFECASFQMGQNQKLSVPGTLTVNANSATLGDVSTLGDMVINANTILLLTRAPGAVLNADGTFTQDTGLDFVTGGRFFFKVAPIAVGNLGVIAFGASNLDADALGTLGAFEQRLLASPVTTSSFNGPGGQRLDLVAFGPPPGGDASTALAAAQSSLLEPADEDEPPINVKESLEQARLRQRFAAIVSPELLGIRMPTATEYQALAAGEVAFSDQAPTTPVVTGAARSAALSPAAVFPALPYEAVLQRVSDSSLAGFVNSYEALAAADRQALDQALANASSQGLGLGEVAQQLSSEGNGEALRQLARLEQLVRSAETIGFNVTEEMRVYRAEGGTSAPQSPLAAAIQRRLFTSSPSLTSASFNDPAYQRVMSSWRAGQSG